jgi:Fe-Mn family superoxide dismutase
MKHVLPDLPFPKNALEPYISSETIELHYGAHHKGYIDKLNALIPGTPFETMPLIETVKKSTGDIFHNAAQAWNHEFYWKGLAPNSFPPQTHLLYAINRKFRDFEFFSAELKKAALEVFGSGWVWLVVDCDGHLEIETTQNAGNPLRHDSTPLLTIDVWEHAYYVDYQNDRARYLDSISSVLNWKFAEQNFIAALRDRSHLRRGAKLLNIGRGL